MTWPHTFRIRVQGTATNLPNTPLCSFFARCSIRIRATSQNSLALEVYPRTNAWRQMWACPRSTAIPKKVSRWLSSLFRINWRLGFGVALISEFDVCTESITNKYHAVAPDLLDQRWGKKAKDGESTGRNTCVSALRGPRQLKEKWTGWYS